MFACNAAGVEPVAAGSDRGLLRLVRRTGAAMKRCHIRPGSLAVLAAALLWVPFDPTLPAAGHRFSHHQPGEAGWQLRLDRVAAY